MATNLIRIRTGSTSTTSGREVIDVVARLAEDVSRLRMIFDAMHQQSDLGLDFTTPAAVFGITDEADALSASQAQVLYNEMNAVLGNSEAAAKQLYAMIKQ